MTPQKQREGRRLRPEFRRRSTRQRHDSPETTRRSPFTPRISRMLHTPASRQAENNERVTTYALNFEDAPGASITTPQKKTREGRTYARNFADAPRISITRRQKQREGGHLRPEFRRCFTRQRHDASKTTRGSPPMPRIWRTLHASAFRQVENNEQVTTYAVTFEDAARASVRTRRKQREAATCAQNFADAPRTSIMTRRKQREGRHLP